MSETDALGHINNAKYFTYMEEGRFDLINKLDLNYSKNEALIVVRTTCDFLQQGYYGQTLHVQTAVQKMDEKSLTFISHIRNKETDELIAKGETVVVYFRLDLQQSQQIPEKYKNKFKQQMYEERGASL